MRRGVVILGFALAGCSVPAIDEPVAETGESGAEPSEPDEPLPPLPSRPSNQSCRLDGTPADALPRLEAGLAGGQLFPDAVQILAAPTLGAWVVERGGRIWWIPEPASPAAQLVVDLGDRVDCCSSRGLLAAAIGPGPELFVHYHRAVDPHRTRVARLSFDAALHVADPDSEQVVIEIDHDGVAASGGALVFDGAGMLLVGVGDDSAAALRNPASSPARDRLDLRGSVLRLDVSGDGPGYAIPPDNPFVGDPEALPELLATGFHDPRACVAELESDRIWCSDIGSGLREEFDALVPGGDFGWPIVEGFRCTVSECEPALFAGPHADYGLDDPDATLEHCAITAGFGYGASPPHEALAKVQLFGDRCSGRTFGLRTDAGPGAFEVVAAVPGGIAAIGPDADDQPWIIDGQGRLARLDIAPDGVPGTLPSRLSETGCFGDAPSLEPRADLVPFLVASPLWSDGLLKQRYMVVPPGERVRVHADGRWSFPESSVLIKTFIHEQAPGEPHSRRPIETRFMVRRNGAWEFYSYRWNADGSDAQLLDGESTVALTNHGADEPGEFEWTFPDRVGCRNCHGFASGRPLGPITAQLHREVRYGDGPPESQLAALAALDLLEFEGGAPDLQSLPALSDPRDPSAPLDARARAYLQANCAHCHHPAWMRPDLRASAPLAETGLCEPTEFPSPWVPGAFRIVPGAPEQSNLWLRMGTRGKGQMPQLGTALVDPLGHALIGEWIAALDDCE